MVLNHHQKNLCPTFSVLRLFQSELDDGNFAVCGCHYHHTTIMDVAISDSVATFFNHSYLPFCSLDKDIVCLCGALLVPIQIIS